MKEQKTEMWMNLGVIAVATVALAIDKISGEMWLGVIAAVSGVYTVGRSYLKAKNGNGEVK